MTTMDAPAPLLPEILALHGRWRANHPALICDEVSETWSEFTRNLNRCANALLAGGVATGERVAVVMSNSAGMVHALRQEHQVVEGGAAVGIAALLAGKVAVTGRTVVVIVSGGNVDVAKLVALAT